MLEFFRNLEVLQVAIAVPVVIAGAAAAAVVRRRPPALLASLAAFAVACALVGFVPVTFADALRLDPPALRTVLVVLKFAAVFGLLLIFGATGLQFTRRREPAA